MAFNNVWAAAQLGYYDESEIPTRVVFLPVWVSNSQDLARVDRAIRENAFGSIPYMQFFLNVPNGSYNVVTPSSLGDNNATQVRIFGPTGLPITSPSYGVIRNLFLT